ncbi:terminase small subunit [Clostridium sp.]|uniref:terminase small subunit n=1 Tax=Clostridium sp. TaxID=1506 RepID=UPI002A8BD5F4|nr:terminase small subunit [Clostridium sp.]
MAKLTEKQKIFANEYLIDLNATRAYKTAYPSCKKEDTAAQAGSRMLRNVKVKEYIDKRMKEREIRTEITQDKVLQELAMIAFSNGTDFAKVVEKPIILNGIPVLDEEGNQRTYRDVELELTDNLPMNKKKAITAIKNTKFGIAIETADKVKALELLGKHLGMFKDKLEVSGNINNPYEGLSTEDLKKLIKDG